MAIDDINPSNRTFVNEFNRRLGQYTRNPVVRTPEVALSLSIGARLLNEQQRRKVQENLDRQEHADKLRETRKGGEPKYGALSQDTANLLTDSHNQGIVSHIDIPSWVPGNDAISEGINKVVGPAKTPALWLLDKISRPSYGAFEAGKELSESLGEGQNLIEALPDVAGGAWSGLSGKEKTGFGEVIQAQVDAGASGEVSPIEGALTGGLFGAVGQQFGRYQDRSGTGAEVQKWAQRVGGLSGELALDPVNLVGGKIFTAVGGAVKSGQNADDVYRGLISKAVDDSIDSKGLAKQFDVQKPIRRPDPNNPGKFISPNLPVGRTALHDAAQRGLDNATVRIGGGATEGRVIGSQVGAFTIANNVSNEMRNFLLRNFDTVHAEFDDILSSSRTLTKADIAKLRKDPIVAAYFDEIIRLTRQANPATSLADIEKILLRYSTRTKDKILSISNQAAEHAKSKLDDLIVDTRTDIFNRLDNQVKNIPGMRIGNKEIPFKRLGTAYHAAKAHTGSPFKGVQFSEQFPSITPQIAQAVKSTGQDAYEAFHASVQDIVKLHKYTKEERRGFNQRILTNTPASTPRLQEGQDFIQKAYRQQWEDEVNAGIRSADDIMPNNYVYNYYKPKGYKDYVKDLDNYRDSVKLHVKGSKALASNHITAAQTRGLRVEQDAFRALLFRQLKSNRQLTQAWFKDSLLDNFGIMANRLSSVAANKNRLIPINAKLSVARKKTLEKGDQWYLPEDINKVFEKYVDMTKGNASGEMAGFLNIIDTVTRWFKQSATIYYPGFHIRNSLGDMFMSFIDGVRASDYNFLKRTIRAVKNDPNKTIPIGGVNFTWDEIKKLFDQNVSTGGFKRTDFDTPGFISKIGPVKNVDPRRISSGIREASEKREDFFRFTHFLHAFKEELPKALKNGTTRETAIEKATRTSAYRVNKYLFDYGASTAFEKKYLKRLFPFYTYTRKAMPALAEGMFLHPSQFAKTNRFFLDDDDGSYGDMLTPSYLREIGYSKLTDGENPWLLGGQFLPTDVLNRNTDILNVPEFARNVMSQTNPLVKMGPELAAEEQFFNQRAVDSTPQYISDSFLPFVSPTKKLAGGIKALPGVPGSGDKRNFLSGRFGLGLPISQVSNNQQTAALYGILDQYKAELGKLNPKLEENGFRIYVSPRQDGASFRIRNEDTGDVIFDTTDLRAAMDRAKLLSK